MDELNEALKHLPHGPEFRFLDELTSLDPGITGAGIWQLLGTEFFFKGHFPGDPILPGVLVVEAIAQLAGVVAQSDPIIGALPNLKLTAIRGAKILGTARPGDKVNLTASIVGRMGNLIQAEGQAEVAGTVILQTQLTLSGTA
jgi:3-hydroxyacyl-[acyl-carrier-protein] dehydratase